jgi:hypothetical protein
MSSDPIIKELTQINDDLSASTNTTYQILKSENARLVDRQNAIIDAQFGQNRIIDLNRSQMKRTAAYTRVGILTVISLGIVLLLRLFGTFIPEAILGLIYVVLISICVLYGIYVYADVRGRESTNYDRYNIPPPVVNLSGADKAKQLAGAQKVGDLLAINADASVCSGQACCDYNKLYESSSNTCSGSCPTGEYFVKAQNKCATCVATANSGYIKATRSCETCSGITPAYDSTSMSCVAAAAP